MIESADGMLMMTKTQKDFISIELIQNKIKLTFSCGIMNQSIHSQMALQFNRFYRISIAKHNKTMTFTLDDALV